MKHRFTLYEQRRTRMRRINRNINIAAAFVAAAVCFGLLWATHLPGVP